MNNGIFGEGFPYTNFHDLNMDWIIKIVKDFLEQYTGIQQLITEGIETITETTETGVTTIDNETLAKIEELNGLAEELEQALQAWYDTHSEDIASELQRSLTRILQYTQDTIASIPADYSTLSAEYSDLRERLYNTQRTLTDNFSNIQIYPVWYEYGIDGTTGLDNTDTSQIHTDFIYCDSNIVNFIPKTGYLLHIRWYSNLSVSSFVSAENSASGEKVPGANWFRLVCTRSDFSDNILPSEGSGNSVKIYRSLYEPGYIMSSEDNNGGYQDNVEVDTISKTISFGVKNLLCRLYSNKSTSYDIRGKTFNYANAPTFIHILYNTETGNFEYSGAEPITAPMSKYIEVGTLWNNSNTYINLKCYPGYSVNGIRTTHNDERYYLSDLHDKNGNATFRLIILGDSISTYDGISESSVGQQTVRGTYYPTSDVTSADDMWYNVLRKCCRSNSGYIVSAVSRSSFRDIDDPTIPPVWNDDRIARLAAFVNPKYIFIECGVNEQWNSLANIGTPTNKFSVSALTAESNTSCRGLELTIRKLQTEIPDIKIVLLIPPFTWGDTVTNFEPYTAFRNYMHQIAKTYGIFRVIDLANCITPTNRSSYTIDGIHPNKAGMARIGHYVAQKLMYDNNSLDY